jgi:tubulin alpha
MNAFRSSQMMTQCDPNSGLYMKAQLIYRGDIVPKDVSTAFGTLKTSRIVKFGNWCQAGWKVGITYQPTGVFKNADLANVNRAVCMISNSTAIGGVFRRLGSEFDRMYSKREFMGDYLSEGMEEAEFDNAREAL